MGRQLSPDEKKILTVEEAAKHLRLNSKTLYKLLDEGKIPAVQFKRKWLIHKETIDALVQTALTVKEAAKYLGLSEKTLYQLLKEDEIPAIRLGKKWLIHKEALDALVKTGGS